MVSSLNNIGYIYNYQDDYVEALKYFYESLKINEELEDEEMIAKGLNNIGFVYHSQNDTAKALDYFQKSLKIRNKIGDDFGVSIALNNIGRIYTDQNHDSLALNLFQRSLIISESIDDQKGIAVSLSNMGSIYFDRGNILEAKSLFLKAYDLSLSMGYPAYISNFSRHLSEIAVKENNYKDAYEMYKLHIIYRDSVNNIETQKAAIQERTKYEYEAQKADDDVENIKLVAIEKEQKEKQKLITYVVAASLGLVALFLGFVFNRLHVTKKQKQKISDQKLIVEETHTKITDSINYAKHLQNAILPAFSEIDKYIQESFILFQPKDVVSGDFYWFEHKDVNGEKKSLIASADCTGHGVPGAMISVVCSNALDRAVNEFGILEPSKILDKTRELVIETFAKSGEEVRDGMDIALCVFTDNKVVFSGANNPLWIVRDVKHLTQEELELKTTVVIENKALIEFKSNKQPIGLYERMVPFSQVDIELIKGDIVYIFTDGFSDQFGGEKHKKFKYEPFKRLLIKVSELPMSVQKEKISTEFKTWKKDLDQVDDICVIGIKPV